MPQCATASLSCSRNPSAASSANAAPRPPPRHRNPTVRLNLELLEERTPATSLTLFGNPLYLVEGQFAMMPYNFATLSDSDGDANASHFSVTINWGDGSATAPAYLFWNGSNFGIMAPMHAYAHAGDYQVSINATDTDGDHAFLQETAHVADAPLTGNMAMPVFATAGQMFSQSLLFFNDGNSYDTAGDFTASINWGDGSPTSAGTVSGSSGSFSVSGSHAYDTGGNYNISINVQDGGGSSLSSNDWAFVANPPPVTPTWVNGSPTFMFNAMPSNPPSFTYLANRTNTEGDVVELHLNPLDPQNPPLHYDAVNLPSGLAINHANGLISGTVGYQAAEQFGSAFATTVVAVNARGVTATQSFTWTINDAPRAPTLTDPGSQTSVPGDAISLQIHAAQQDGDQILYSAANLPAGLTIDTLSGKIYGTVDADAGSDEPYAVTVTAANNTVTASESFNWSVAQVQAPVLTAPADQTNVAGDTPSLSLVITNPHGLPLTYSAVGLPGGLSINATTGVISGTVAATAVNETAQQVTVSATDGTETASQTFYWKVNGHVVVEQPPAQLSAEGQWIALDLVAGDADGSAVSYTATGLPAGLSINPDTAQISGAIAYTVAETSGGLYSVTVTGTDSLGGSDSKTFAWTVSDASFASTGQDVKAAELVSTGATAVARFTVANPTAQPGDFSALIHWGDGTQSSATILPDADPGSFLVVGSHTYAVTGVYDLVVTVTDGETTTDTPATAYVDPAPLTAFGQTVQATASQPFFDAVVGSFTDGNPNRTASAYTAFINWGDGAVNDPGFILGSAGAFTVSGNHTYAEPGTYSVSTILTNLEGGNSAIATSSIVVQPAPLTLTAVNAQTTEGANAVLTLANLHNGNANEPNGDLTVAVNWGDGTSGNADAITGDHGDFVIAGHHLYAEAGVYQVHLALTDSRGGSAAANLTMTVAEAPLTVTGLPVSAVQWNPEPVTVAMFKDADLQSVAADFTAQITWRDVANPLTSLVTYGSVSGWGGVYTATSFLPYAIHTGNYTATVVIQDMHGAQAASAASPVTIGDLFVNQQGMLGVYSFTSNLYNAQISDFTAAINWGDGADANHPDVTSAQITGGGGIFSVNAAHQFASPGSHTIQVAVTSRTGATITANKVVTVAEKLSGVGQEITTGESAAPVAFVLGKVFTGDLSAAAGAFQTAINWGDGTALDTWSGHLVANAAGGFDLEGEHAYAKPGEFHVVAAEAKDGGSVTAVAKAVVKPDWSDTTKYALKLDVNANGVLGDKLEGGVLDGVENYTPGYAGTAPMLTTGATFNKTQFNPQEMRLVLDGVGEQVLAASGGASVTFEIGAVIETHLEQQNGRPVTVFKTIPMVTSLPGYAGNATANAIDSPGKKQDYSFDPAQDSLKANAANVKTSADSTGTSFWAKDYGGKATIWAIVQNAAGDVLHTFDLTVPVDKNDNGIADVWERSAIAEWKAWTGDTQVIDPMTWIKAFDQETANQSAAGVPSATVGDGLTVGYEYRGVIVDGGGQTPDGKKSQQGHIRLSTAVKQVLIDVDAMASAVNPAGKMDLPKGAASELKIRDWMERVTAAYSQQNLGAGIQGFYVLHHTDAPNRTFAHFPNGTGYEDIHSMWQDQSVYVNSLRGSPGAGTRQYYQYWRHLTIGLRPTAIDDARPLFVNETHHFLSGVAGMSTNVLNRYTERIGSFFFADESYYLWNVPLRKLVKENGIDPMRPQTGFTFDGYAVGTITHEMAHQLQADYHNIQGGHYADSDGDGTKNTASDMRSVLFAYDQPRALLGGYYAQDYWQPIQYGQGSSDGFLPNMDLQEKTMLDQPNP